MRERCRVVSLSATTANASWSMVGRCRSTRIRPLPVVPNPDAAGRPEYGRCRSSRIRALPVVAKPGAAGRPTASDHTESELALGPEHSPRDGDKWRTARRQPSCCSDDRFWERKVRGEDWERELELGWAPPVVPNLGVAGRPESGRYSWSRIRGLRVVANPGAAGRHQSGHYRSSHCQRPQGKRVGAWTGALRPRDGDK